MRLGDAPANGSRTPAEGGDDTRPDFHNLSETTDRRLVVVGSMSGAGVVLSGALLALAINAMDVTPVAATSWTIVALGGVGTGLICGGVFSSGIGRAKREGLLGEMEEGNDFSGSGLDAWDTQHGDDIQIFRL